MITVYCNDDDVSRNGNRMLYWCYIDDNNDNICYGYMHNIWLIEYDKYHNNDIYWKMLSNNNNNNTS